MKKNKKRRTLRFSYHREFWNHYTVTIKKKTLFGWKVIDYKGFSVDSSLNVEEEFERVKNNYITPLDKIA